MKDYKHLSFASTLCGACTEVCPVKIPLHDLLLKNRKDAVDQKLSSSQDKWLVKIWERVMLKRKLLDFFGARTKNMMASLFMKKSWGTKRNLPKVADKSFNKRWLEQHPEK